jgi:hypothetical protein
MRAEGALNAALHHMHAPQQQSDRAGEIDQRQGGVHSALPRLRMSALTAA